MNSVQLTDVDRQIVAALSRDGRIPYKELARQVGLPVSTCHGRVRMLESRGVIAGYRAEIDPEAAGREVQALISLRVHPHKRDQVPQVVETVSRLRGVQRVFLVGGDKDVVVHVATAKVAELRDLIAEHFGADPALAQTQTQLVFEYRVGSDPI